MVAVHLMYPVGSLRATPETVTSLINGVLMVDYNLKIQCQSGDAGDSSAWQYIDIDRVDGLRNGTFRIGVKCEKPKVYYALQEVAKLPASTQINTVRACDLPAGSNAMRSYTDPELEALLQDPSPTSRKLMAAGRMKLLVSANLVGAAFGAAAVLGISIAGLSVAMEAQSDLSSLQKKFDALNADANKRLTALDRFQTETAQWQGLVNSNLNKTTAALDTVQRTLETNKATLTNLQAQLDGQLKVAQTTSDTVVNGFAQQKQTNLRLSNDIMGVNSNVQKLAEEVDAKVKTIIAQMNNQTGQVASRLEALRSAHQSQTLWSMAAFQEHARSLNMLRSVVFDLYDRRSLRRMLYRNLNLVMQLSELRGFTPFTNHSQIVSPDEVLLNRRIVQIDQLFVVWTTNTVHQVAEASLRCRAKTMLDIVRPWLGVRDIMAMLGTRDCNPKLPTTGTFLPPAFEQCVCWLEVARRSCPVVPNQPRPVDNIVDWSGKCPTQVSNTVWSNFTNVVEFHEWMNTQVMASLPERRTNDRGMHLYGLASSRLRQSIVVKQASAQQFSMSSIDLSPGPLDDPIAIQSGLPFAFYQYLTQSYQVVTSLVDEVELLAYGNVPDDITYENQPFNRRENIVPYQCIVAAVTSVDPVMVPLYELRLSRTTAVVKVQVDGQEYDIDSSEIDMTNSFMLPTVQYVAGSFYNPSNDSDIYIYDIPNSEVSLSPDTEARGGKITYLAAPAGWDVGLPEQGPWTYERWMEYNKVPIDHFKAGNSLHYYKQGLTPAGKCIGHTTGSPWCTMTDKFDVALLDLNNDGYDDTVSLTPNQDWSLEFFHKVPAGQVVLVRSSQCPTVQMQVFGDAAVTFVFTNTADTTITFQFHVNGPCPETRDVVIGSRSSSTQRITACLKMMNETTIMTVRYMDPAVREWKVCGSVVNVTAELVQSVGLQAPVVFSQLADQMSTTRLIIAEVNQQQIDMTAQYINTVVSNLVDQLRTAGVPIPAMNETGSVLVSLTNLTSQLQETNNRIVEYTAPNLTALIMADVEKMRQIGKEVHSQLDDMEAANRQLRSQVDTLYRGIELQQNKSDEVAAALEEYLAAEQEFTDAIGDLSNFRSGSSLVDVLKEIEEVAAAAADKVSNAFPSFSPASWLGGVGNAIMNILTLVLIVGAAGFGGYMLVRYLMRRSTASTVQQYIPVDTKGRMVSEDALDGYHF